MPPTESVAPDPKLTRMGTAMGTPGYMPPEQAVGETIDERADVYAIGATLYHVLAGVAPYGDVPPNRDVMLAICERPPAPLAEVEPRVPNDLQTIVAKAMARDPADRYASARELAEELRQFQNGNLVDAYQYSRGELFRRWVARNRGLLAAVLVFLAAGAIAVAMYQRREQELIGESEHVSEQAAKTRIGLLQEKGRSELLLGKPLPALAYLGEAYKLGGDGAALRSLLADATRPLDAIEATIEPRGNAIFAAAYRPDGAQVLTATEQGVHVRDPDTGDSLKRLEQGSRAWSVAYSADGKRFATASWDRPAKVWDADTFEVRAELPEPMDSVLLSDDGSLVVTRRNQAAAVWNASTGAPIARIEHPERIAAASLTRDGAYLVTAGYQGTARVTRTRTGALVASIGTGVVDAAPSPDGTTVATGHEDGTVAMWDLRTGAPLATARGHDRRLTSVAFNDEGTLLVSTGEDGIARVWNARGLAPFSTLRGHRARVTGGAFSDDGTRVVTTSRDWTAKVWNARTGKLLLSLEHGAEVVSAAFSPDGMSVIAGGARGAKRWTLKTGKLIARMPSEGGLHLSRFSPDGERIATAGRNGVARLYEASGPTIGQLAHGDLVTSMVFDADGTRLLTASRDGTAKLWEAESGLRVAVYEHGHPVLAAEFHPEGVVTVDDRGTVRVWDAEAATQKRELSVSDQELAAVAVGPDGKLVAIAPKRERRAVLVAIDGGGSTRSLDGHRDEITGLSFSPDGNRLVTASLDSTARIWDVKTTTVLATLEDHDAAINFAAFDMAGKRVVTASDDGTAKLWDADAGMLLATLDGHERPVLYAVFDTGGNRVITASADGGAILWDTSLETRSRADIARLIEQHVPWKVDGDVLVPRE
jgi:WD40 repeat protein